MTQQIINVGTAPNDGQGDPIRTAFEKTNNNFSQLFSLEGNSITNGTSNIRIPSANANIYASVGNVANVAIITNVGITTNSLTASGNVTANYFIGDGSLLTGIGGGNASSITNGNSNVQVYSNGNVAVSVSSVSNVAVFTQSGVLAPKITATAGIVYNSNTITGNNVVGAGLNGLSVGPLSMDSSATMSLPSGQRWLVM